MPSYEIKSKLYCLVCRENEKWTLWYMAIWVKIRRKRICKHIFICIKVKMIKLMPLKMGVDRETF